MEIVGSTAKNPSITGPANPPGDANLHMIGNLTKLVTDVKDGKGVAVLLIALEIIEDINQRVHALVNTVDAETRSVMSDVSKDFWRCNEETLALVDFLTTSKAELEDTFTYYKEAGHEAERHPEAIKDIKDWIAKAKELQLVDDMQKQIERTTESYMEFLRDVDSASNKLGSRNRDLAVKYGVLVGVAAVACLGVAASVGYLAVSLTAETVSAVAVSDGFAAFYGSIVLSFKAVDWVGKVGDASTSVQKALTALGNIKESGDGLVTELQAVTSSVESVERCIKQVEKKLSNLDDTVEGFDHDRQNLIHCGRKLVKECDQMQQQFSELGRQIERLREQVNKAQRSRWN
ncbi:hypothetical protein CY35_18G100500 [Sphagnum magellanicum]|nr:hypothetical protein CY35_18G100500 [Sphagnum magellanicum]